MREISENVRITFRESARHIMTSHCFPYQDKNHVKQIISAYLTECRPTFDRRDKSTWPAEIGKEYLVFYKSSYSYASWEGKADDNAWYNAKYYLDIADIMPEGM